jgi:hypothetical protein
VAKVQNPYFLRIPACLFVVFFAAMAPVFAQVNVLVEAGSFGPIQLVLNGALLNSQPVSTAVIAGLDTNAHRLEILVQGRVQHTRILHFVEPGNHKLVAQTTRDGQMVLRYRGHFEQQAGYPVFLMDLENLPKKSTPQLAELPASQPIPPAPKAQPANTAVLKPSLKPVVEHTQSLAGEFERLSYLKKFLEDNNFAVADLLILGQLLKFEHTRLQFFVAAYKGCEDPENYSKLESLLEFEASLNTIRSLKNR